MAKAAAEIILLEQDLGVVHAGVMEGRRTIVNTGKYILMASSANLGNIFSMVLAGLILPFLPLLPIQVLLTNSDLRLRPDRITVGQCGSRSH